MEPFVTLHSTGVVLPLENVDTDQIIPARFLKTTDRLGLGNNLFADWRYDASGAPRPEFVLNRPEARSAQLLVAGKNFGCGSSREHAPWGLHAHGFRAVISTGIADIFSNNALKNGLVPIVVDASTHAQLLASPNAEIAIDLERLTLTLPGGAEVPFKLEAFARYCLLNGVDETGYLLSNVPAIEAYERAHA